MSNSNFPTPKERKMKTISELIGQNITPTGRNRAQERVKVLSDRLSVKSGAKKHAIFETEVFNYFFDNRDALKIESVIRFANLSVDGQIVLSDRTRFVVEVKKGMNWDQAIKAQWEFRGFLLRTDEARNNPVNGAIVIFDEFTRDWKQQRNGQNVLGWETWYVEYRDAIPNQPMFLLRLRDNELYGYPD